MSRQIEFYLVDIFIAQEKIARYCHRFESAEAFLHSELEWDAVIRELEIIGEATNKLLQNSSLTQEYRTIVDFRNHIVHGYFGIDETIVWEVVTQLLPQFIKALHTFVEEEELSLNEAIACAKEDHHYNSHTLHLLTTLTK